jgi:hypothetical protein
MLQEERDKFEKKMEETRLRLEAHASEVCHVMWG